VARSRQPATPIPPPGPLALTRLRADVAPQLQDRIKLGKEIQESSRLTVGSIPKRDLPTYKRDAIKWSEFNVTLLETVFTNNTVASEYKRAAFGMSINAGDTGTAKLFAEGVDQQIQKLESVLERLDLYAELPAVLVEARERIPIEYRDQKVFIVHGHDEAALQVIARFLETIGLQAIVLREQPDQGRTTIEKFEACAREVGFAVALLTPDDLGGSAAALEQAARARQNVIFELGYFVGRLGRGRACVVRKGELEIPSDLFGVVYTTLDHPAEGWKIRLARELRAAGFEFDPARVLA
jgi:predicted nucleotide-binding protein